MTWLTTKQAAARTHRDPSTITRDAQAEVLHGHQKTGRDGRPKPGSRWSFAEAAVDAWMQGLDLRAQKQACGCAHLTAVRRAG